MPFFTIIFSLLGKISPRGWLVIGGLVLVLAIAGYIFYLQKRAEEAERIFEQGQSDAAAVEIQRSQTNVNKIDEQINAVRNENLSNMKKDDLRDRIIKKAREQK